MILKFRICFLLFICSGNLIFGQNLNDSIAKNKWTNHFQLTFIEQKHSGFKSAYSGEKSLADTVEPFAASLTSTFYLGRQLWKGATIYCNPEISGGKGLSFASGVAGALNGETYRVGSTEPQPFIARAYLKQIFPLGHTSYEEVEDDINQVAGSVPSHRVTISLGKFAISDFYDDNMYSKDPRSQFFNWALWANGAWDYPANTRGYTMGAVLEFIQPGWKVRISSVAVPRAANGSAMEYDFKRAHSETFELSHKYSISRRPGHLRLLISNTYSKAPSYADGLKAVVTNNKYLLNVIQGNEENTGNGGKKIGMGLNLDQELTNDIGLFSRIGWNDGKHVSWAFTEIDRTVSLGLSIKGQKWNRQSDVWGIASVINGISSCHRNYLKAGGYGFIIGDGNLNYSNEFIFETFYNAHISKSVWVTFDYQFVNNPAYNKDRGPVHVFGIRSHIEL